MRQQMRYLRLPLWLVLAAMMVVTFDAGAAASTPSARVPVPAAHVASITDVFTPSARPDGQVPPATRAIDLEPVDGLPLSYAERDSLVRLALGLVGVPYHFGGTTPDRGFDCSGLVGYVLSRLELDVPRLAYQQARVGSAVARSELRPGDLLTFGRDSISHVGIYIGNGRFVHASSVARRVIVSPLDRPASALIRPLHGARRLLVAIASPNTGV